MRRKKWWRIVLPGVIIAKVIFILSLLNASFKNDETAPQIVEHYYKSVEIPDTLYFAGEEIPIRRFDVRESLDRELLVNSYFHSQTIRFIKLVPRYFPIIEPILKEKGIPDDFKYLAVAESNLDPKAVSPAGAVGFWQFMRGTAGDYGLEVNNEVDERYHVEKATRAACDYLLDSYRKNGTWTLVAAAYNSGNNYVATQMERQKSRNYFDLLLGEETDRYMYRIIALKLVLENPEKYGFRILESEKYPLIETREVEVTGPVNNFAGFAGEHGISYRMLKYFNPWLRDIRLTNAGRKKYLIKIPSDIDSVKPVD